MLKYWGSFRKKVGKYLEGTKKHRIFAPLEPAKPPNNA